MAEFLTSLDQIALLRKAMGNPATGDVSDAECAQYLWMGECDIAEMYEFEELRSYEDIDTVASQLDYEMGEDSDVLKFLYPADNLTGNFPVKMMDAQWDRRVGSLMTGVSSVFYFFENGLGENLRKKIRFRPVPSGGETIRIPFIMVPTMPDYLEISRSQIPVSHTFQVLARAAEIGLQMIGERGEAQAQQQLTAKTTYAARHALPPAAFYRRRLSTFQDRMNRRRARRG